ncbi:MAG: hypothetical protein JST12_14855 [Armatimonadetes bacterium]|nr:hypothetical protein [Armatimonadota bacterium]
MIASAEGFGGVVFGNTVTDSQAPGRLTSIAWIADYQGSTTGRLELRYRSSRGELIQQQSGPYYVQDVAAAMEMVSPTSKGAKRPKNGDGIGLVGLDTVHQSNAKSSIGRIATFFPVIMNPALIDTRLGWAALMGDSLPIEQDYLKKESKRLSSSSATLTKKWLDNAPDTWKFVDKDMYLLHQNGRVLVLPGSGSLAIHSSKDFLSIESGFLKVKAFRLQRTALDIQVADGGDTDPFVTQFQDLLPNLIRFSNDYALLNRFAPVCALVRYAKEQGAAFVNRPSVVKRNKTPRSLGIGETFFVTRY